MGFAEKMIHVPESEIILSIGIQLDLETGLKIPKQRKLLSDYLQTAERELGSVKSYAAWVWGESIDNNTIRLNVVKQVLEATNISFPEDAVILDALEDYN